MDWSLLLIPLVSAVIGYATNFAGIRMLFVPVQFVGFRVPGLRAIARILPRKLQAVPGLADGKVGWQGVIPCSRSAPTPALPSWSARASRVRSC